MDLARVLVMLTLALAKISWVRLWHTLALVRPKEMAKFVPLLDTPEFKNPPTPSFYSATDFLDHYGAGMLSSYGKLILVVYDPTHCGYWTGRYHGNDGTEPYESVELGCSGRKDGALKVSKM